MIIKKISLITIIMVSTLCIVGCRSTIEDDDVIATINGKDITVGYYKKTLEFQRQDIENKYGTNIWREVQGKITYEEQFEDDILNEIINTYAVYDKAKADNLLPNDDQLKSSIDLKKDLINLRENREYLIDTVGINEEYLKEYQEKFLTLTNYKNKFIKDNTNVSDKEIKDYYNNNQDEFYKEEVRASHILISTNYEGDSNSSDKNKKQAKEEAEEILERIKNGENFEQLAIENSDCTSNVNGGDLGYFSKGRMVERFEYIAFKLNTDEISDIVETEYGYHIIKVTDKRKELMSLEDAQYLAKQNLLNKEFDKKIEKILNITDIEKNYKIIKRFKEIYTLSD